MYLFLELHHRRHINLIYYFSHFFSYITHILEKACQLDESALSKPYLKLESTFNIQASRTTGVVTELASVRAETEENSVIVHEEKDGRINVE
jgi:hypothetical protein